MIILSIKQPGLYINIPGIPPFRTPAEINITKIKNIPMVLSQLKNSGVDEYEIKNSQRLTITKPKIETKNKITKTDYNDELNTRLTNIENLLMKVLKKDPLITEQIIKTSSTNINNKNKNNEAEINFIPEINIDSMKGSITNETTDLEENNDDIVDLLKKIIKKSEDN